MCHLQQADLWAMVSSLLQLFVFLIAPHSQGELLLFAQGEGLSLHRKFSGNQSGRANWDCWSTVHCPVFAHHYQSVTENLVQPVHIKSVTAELIS